MTNIDPDCRLSAPVHIIQRRSPRVECGGFSRLMMLLLSGWWLMAGDHIWCTIAATSRHFYWVL